jgi:hypothetical protein
MSYSGYNGLGCSGTNGCGCSGNSGMGAYFPGHPRRRSMRGFGSMASTFNAEAVWADVQAGAAGNNLAGKRAAQAIQAGLSELGYSCPPTGSFDNATIAQWKSFKSKNGLPAGSGLVQKDGLVLMEAQLKQGKVTGPNEPVSYVTDGGEYIKEDSITPKKAGIGMGMMLLLGAVVVGGVVLIAKKKKSQQSTSMRVGRQGMGRDMDSYGSSGLYASVKE